MTTNLRTLLDLHCDRFNHSDYFVKVDDDFFVVIHKCSHDQRFEILYLEGTHYYAIEEDCYCLDTFSILMIKSD